MLLVVKIISFVGAMLKSITIVVFIVRQYNCFIILICFTIFVHPNTWHHNRLEYYIYIKTISSYV